MAWPGAFQRNRTQIKKEEPGGPGHRYEELKKIKVFFERYKAASVTALTLFAVCSVVVIAGLVKTYAQANGTVYLSKVIDRAYPEDDFSDQVHLFKAEYDGTVRSEDGKTNVIAPGTRNSYTLDISNDTQQDLYYGFKVYAEVKNSPLRDNVPLQLPVALSVTGPDGELIRVGLDGEEGHKYLDGYSIKEGRVQSFAFYWEWLFETGDDEADTMWGNAATSEAPPELDVYIQLYLGKDTYAYTATFDPVDGTLIGRNHKLLFNGAPYGEMPGAKKENFSFLGWFTDDGKLVTSEMIVTGLTEDITLHARYERNFDDYFEVRFDANGGTLDDPTQAERTVKDGEPFGDLPKASFPGKELIGWNTEPDGSGEMITTETLADLDRDITLYAIYEDAGSVIHVTFDAGVHGNVIGNGEKTVVKGEPYGDLPYAESPGKNFIGWNTKKDGSGTMIGRDTIVTLTKDTVVYAIYAEDAPEISHLVNFDAGEDGYVKGGPSPERVTDGYPYGQLPYAERPGYVFEGWYDEAGNEVTPDTIVQHGPDETLHARYTRKEHTGVVTFDAGEGGTVNVYPQKEIAPNSTYGKLPKALMEGKVFVGWYTEPGGAGVLITPESATGDAEDITLYAYYADIEETKTHVITYDAGEGILIGRKRKTVVNGEPYGELSRGELAGKNFVGWFTEPYGKGIRITEDILAALKDDITLYACYESDEDTITLTFDAGEGGKLIGPAVKHLKYGVKYGELPWAEKDGFLFIGWFTAPGEGGNLVTRDTKALEDARLYAHYAKKENYYTVTFDPMEGHLFGPSKKIVANGERYGQLPKAEVDDFRKFGGWSFEPEGRGGRVYPNTIVNLTGDVTLYAFYIIELNPSYRTSEPNQGVIRYGYPQKGAKVSTGDWELVDADRMNWVFHGKNGFASGGWFFVKNQYSAGGITTAQWFHFNEQGLMDKGWIKVGEKDWYHLREIPDGDLGSLEKGWYHDDQDQKTYYLDPETGLMWYGWQEIDGEWYYFADESDIAGTNWVLDSENHGGVVKWVYDTDRRSYGSMFAGEMTPDGHYVREDGTWDGEGEVPTATKMTPPTNSNVVNGYPETLNGFKYELRPVVGTNYEEIRKRLSEGDQKDTDVYRRIK